ncbi:LysE family translocator [Rhizobiaceae bacterium BDR2-2]|uniref:LysE family translocator n=1 Tax=Ectorhizobium quercum TaxID=2965071 RepID=A0AAE3SW15_9HYPH|nr:LysE family translocator [Ectorhizobium quercum]MCX8996239.1 LysE family translocator [Ectorhizobium quercum]MCX8998722.1 LysE family translocator [Ectorhizobium quercum]
MILDPALTAAYIVLAAALALAPGPDVVFVVANGMRHKARGAFAAALGIGVGSLVHATAAALGVSAVIAASPLAFDIMRMVGAAYLAWLGLQALRAFIRNAGADAKLGQSEEVSVWRVFSRGLITNILNPKVVIFYIALLPQFVNVELGQVGLQVFLLGCIHNAIGLTFLIAVGLAAGKAAGWISRTSVGRWLDGIAGIFFIGLAVRLALTGRPNQ